MVYKPYKKKSCLTSFFLWGNKTAMFLFRFLLFPAYTTVSLAGCISNASCKVAGKGRAEKVNRVEWQWQAPYRQSLTCNHNGPGILVIKLLWSKVEMPHDQIWFYGHFYDGHKAGRYPCKENHVILKGISFPNAGKQQNMQEFGKKKPQIPVTILWDTTDHECKPAAKHLRCDHMMYACERAYMHVQQYR